jgi:hypothetical protein
VCRHSKPEKTETCLKRQARNKPTPILSLPLIRSRPVLASGYEGSVPDGYYVVRSKTYGVLNFMKGYLNNGVEAASQNTRNNLKVYPLSRKAINPKWSLPMFQVKNSI